MSMEINQKQSFLQGYLAKFPEFPRLREWATRSASFIIPVLLIVTWQICSWIGLFHPAALPSPARVWSALLGLLADGTLLSDLDTSALRVLNGFLWGVLIGLAIGILSGLSRFVERLVSPVVDAFRQIPVFAWIPLIILWFGIGELSKGVIIAKSVFVPVFVNTLQGIRGVPQEYVEVARVLELNRWKFLHKVVIPSALPSIFTGIRLGAGFAWMAVVAAEMLGGLSGIGYALMRSKEFFQTDGLIALMAVIGLVGLVVDRSLKWLETSTLRWRKGFAGNGK
ncbi:sulfonate transport system permease protein [Hydrogenispora ethanolica]|uniref:Sulfonate transport system permease protein n=1 Tax=Hydrogenispora ethanolica TaxID=1082276 RepID=A0A4V2QBI4_HYDET|nr:ABC transporter permease [Hydrogenispora ethanolica]TCL56472.1 sulfonate transport system permease protein [Hydrogenispora ethanolica]